MVSKKGLENVNFDDKQISNGWLTYSEVVYMF